MGGGYYDRDVISNTGATSINTVVGTQSGLNAGLDPKTYIDEENRIINDNLNPIVFALDVTGSMGEWPRVQILCKLDNLRQDADVLRIR
jgi:hypothetical protein